MFAHIAHVHIHSFIHLFIPAPAPAPFHHSFMLFHCCISQWTRLFALRPVFLPSIRLVIVYREEPTPLSRLLSHGSAGLPEESVHPAVADGLRVRGERPHHKFHSAVHLRPLADQQTALSQDQLPTVLLPLESWVDVIVASTYSLFVIQTQSFVFQKMQTREAPDGMYLAICYLVNACQILILISRFQISQSSAGPHLVCCNLYKNN